MYLGLELATWAPSSLDPELPFVARLLLLCLRVGTPGAPELAFGKNRHELGGSIYLRVGVVALLLARVNVGGSVDLPRCRVLLISKG